MRAPALPFSLEATRPSLGEIADAATIVGRGCELFLSAVAAQSLDQLAAVAAQVRRAGLEPVPHLSARRLDAPTTLDEFLARLSGEAGARRLLVVGGDGPPDGPYPDALAVIRGGAWRNAGIEAVGIAAYPEGHPKIATERLDAALREKLAAAKQAGLEPFIVTQFSFAPESVTGWLRNLRAGGIDVPVKVGMAGPTSLPSLLRFAKRCGVSASLRGLGSGVAAGLLGHVGPDSIVDALAATPGLGDIAPHYFSFGGLAATTRYAQDKALAAEPRREAARSS